jgi:hypothetical protein
MSNAAYYTASTGGNTYRRWKSNQTSAFGDYGSPSEIIESYTIQKINSTTGAEVLIDFNGADYATMQTAGVIPTIGTTYGADWAGSYNYTTNKHRCRTIEFSIEPRDKVKCVIHWTSYYNNVPGEATKQLLPASIELQSSLRTMTRYRHNVSTAPSATTDVSATDIGGDPVALFGIFATTTVPQVRIRVRLIRDAIVDGVGTINSTITGIINTKNSDTFFGYTAGMLICDGASMIHLGGNYYEVIFELLADSYFRHEQVPTYNNDGTVAMTGSNATEVKWKRQKHEPTAFSAIWFGDTGGAPSLEYTTLKGYWSTF